MASKHRKLRSSTKKVATISAATATVTALTVGVAPPPKANAAFVDPNVDLQADFRPFPPPEQIPDLTGGLGTAGYDLAQEIGAQLLTAFVENINLAALAEAAGVDPESLVTNLLGGALDGVLASGLGAVPLDLTGVVTPLLEQVLTPALGETLAGLVAGVVGPELADALDAEDLGGLLDLLGLDLSSPLDLSGDPVPGLNVVTAGWPFTLLKLLGVDLGWVPPFPNSIAEDINNTDYLDVGVAGLLDELGVDVAAINLILDALTPLEPGPTLADLPDLVALRAPIVIGVGLGAFAAGAAYPQVVADLPNQPGGAAFTGTDPILGSFTIMPMLLIDNPGRANGGILARAYPLFRLVGIDTVTPDTQVQSSTDGEGLLNDVQFLGLTLGGANLIPIKIDATAEYLPMSDFAAWPTRSQWRITLRQVLSRPTFSGINRFQTSSPTWAARWGHSC
ncbi:hypothetical protein [Mycobacterium hubeiense]|uniref:hypothetical protein n=1 Tax=Mycobacterium hubeiense TaxID=1867256 RepID=UPI0018EACE4F|nr:hypothetical protein [Mycobacterium sp. QGD 101]